MWQAIQDCNEPNSILVFFPISPIIFRKLTNIYWCVFLHRDYYIILHYFILLYYFSTVPSYLEAVDLVQVYLQLFFWQRRTLKHSEGENLAWVYTEIKSKNRNLNIVSLFREYNLLNQIFPGFELATFTFYFISCVLMHKGRYLELLFSVTYVSIPNFIAGVSIMCTLSFPKL